MDEKQTLEFMRDLTDKIMSRIYPIIDTEIRDSKLTAKDKAIVIRHIKACITNIEDYYIGIAIMQENKQALTADKAEGK